MRDLEKVTGEKPRWNATTVLLYVPHWEALKKYVDGTRTSASEVIRVLLYRWLRDQGRIKADDFDVFGIGQDLELEAAIKSYRAFLDGE